MPFEFKLPDIGEGIAEGEIIKWLVKEGDVVKEDQPLVQIETDKAVVDLPSPRAGTIQKINFADGAVAKVGAVLVTILETGEKELGKRKEDKKETPKETLKKEDKKEVKKQSTKGQSVVGQLEEAPEESDEVKPIAQVMRGPVQSQKILAAPAIRKLASDLHIDLSKIEGSGEGGIIIPKDLEQVMGQGQKQEIPQQNVALTREYTEGGYVERIPLKGIRKTMAQNMVKSMTETAQVTIMGDVDIQKIWDLREKEKIALAKKGIKLTFLPFIIKAVVAALKEHPMLNATLEGDEVVMKRFYNIGIATETEVGLMVPVLKNAQHKSISDIAQKISELAEKARSRTISPEEMKEGTFSITNYGSYGGKYATPILNPPESAILGMGSIFDHVNVSKGLVKNKLVVRKVLPLSLTFDHRIIDGAQAAQFLKTLTSYLEDPSHLFMSVD